VVALLDCISRAVAGSDYFICPRSQAVVEAFYENLATLLIVYYPVMTFTFTSTSKRLSTCLQHDTITISILITNYPSSPTTTSGNERSESHFAKHDGLDVLLELIETSPLVLRLPAMRLLSDLLDNIDLVPYVRYVRNSLYALC
jgi:hypothetical protein